MLEVSKEEDEFEKPQLELEDDEDDDLVEKVQAMRKKVEDQLGVSDGLNEDELKYDVLLEKVRTMTEDNPEDIAGLLQALLTEATGEDNTADIFSAMSVDAITEVSKYIAGSKSIDKAVATAVLEEFHAIFQSGAFITSGGMEYARELLYRTLGADEAKKVLEKLSKTIV
ncbi:hypothetical protein P692DRAFT_20823860 [Suillus brevipes Sb2]|nr:hypothetical protein P692DRAFT_20823860 [Suillus brevipes Sb2]